MTLLYRGKLPSELTIEELSTIAFSDMTDYCSWDARSLRIKPIEEIPEHLRCAIKEIRIQKSGNRREAKIVLHDKVKALTTLGQHLGMFNDFNNAISCLREKYGLRLFQDGDGEWQVEKIT